MPAFPAIVMSSAGASAPVTITLHESPHWQAAPAYAIGLICTVSNGAVLTYSVQVSGEQKPTASGAWNNHDVIVNQTGSVNDSIVIPVTGVRLNVSSYTSGTVQLCIVKWP